MAELSGYQRLCPRCAGIAEADFVDIGVGMQQCGPFGCEACGWVERCDELEFLESEHG